MQQGILDVIRGSGYELLVHPCSRQHPNFLSDIRKFVERQRLFGVVLPPRASEDDKLCAMFDEIGCPYARIAAVALDLPSRMVVTHDRKGAAEAVRHLADLGHRVIGHISGPATFRSSLERHQGVAEGLASVGIEFDPRYYAEGGYTFDSGVLAARALLALDPRPTAIFAGNDEMAAGVYRAAREAGLDVPRDLSVVGFDDSPVAAKVWPPMTTIRLPIREMGAIAARKLLAQAPGAAPEGRDITVQPALVVRQSSAAPLLSRA
jgi:LacI family transcriptional regulator